MSHTVTLEDLKSLLTKREPHQIEADHGSRLNEEARDYLDQFTTFSNRMEHVSEDFEKLRLQENLAFLQKEPPEIKARQTVAERNRPGLLRLGPALAAVVILGLLWLYKPPTVPPEGLPRSAGATPWDGEAAPHHEALFQAFKNRGVFYMDQQDPQASKLALNDFEQAYALNSEDVELVTLLVVVCENLELEDKTRLYKARLSTLGNE